MLLMLGGVLVHSYEFANYMVQLDPEDYSMTMESMVGAPLLFHYGPKN